MNKMIRHLILVILNQFKIVYFVLPSFKETPVKKKFIYNGYVTTFDNESGFTFFLEDLLEMLQYLV